MRYATHLKVRVDDVVVEGAKQRWLDILKSMPPARRAEQETRVLCEVLRRLNGMLP